MRKLLLSLTLVAPIFGQIQTINNEPLVTARPKINNNFTYLYNLVNTKQNILTTGSSGQYIRGDLSIANFPNIPSVTGSTILKGSSGNAVAATALDITNLFGSGSCGTGFLKGDGSCGAGTVSWGAITGTLSSQTDLQTILNGKQNTITTGSTGQYFRGDFSLAAFPTIPTITGSVLLKGSSGNAIAALAADVAALFNSGTCGTNYLRGDGTCGAGTASIAWGAITGTLSTQTDLQNAFNAKQNSITTGTTAQYFRGDLSLATFPTIPTITGSVPLKGSGGNAVAAVATDIAALFNSGTCGTNYLRGDGSCAAGTGSVAWGAVSGTISSQTDLMAAFNGVERNICTMGAACDGTTDDTTVLNTQLAFGGIVTIGAGKTVVASNVTIGSNTLLRLKTGAKLLKTAGSTTTYLIKPTTSSTNVGVECETGGVVDGNSVVQTTAQKVLLFADSITNFIHKGCTYHNSGSPSNTMGAIGIYNTSGILKDFTSDTTLKGVSFKMDCNNTAAKRFLVDNFVANGNADNVIYISNTGATEGACNADVANWDISNVTDYLVGTGQNGNAVVVYRADGVSVHDGKSRNTRYSSVRVDQSMHTHVHHVHADGAQESAFYAELGAKGNQFDHLIISNSMSGLNLTNVGSRSPDYPNVADTITCVGVQAYCVAMEHDQVSNVWSDGVPIGVILGTSNSSHDNILNNVQCSHIDSALPPTFACVAPAQSINSGIDYLDFIISRYIPIGTTGIVPIDIPSGPVISGISKANPAVVTQSAGTLPTAGNTVCFYQVAGMVEINGLCGVVSSPSGSTFNVAINTTSFTTFSIPAGGSPLGKAVKVYSSGTTPAWSISTNTHVRTLP